MRQIFLDTETTGLSPENGDRIIEIGCVELLNRKLSGRNLHLYVNPERDSEEGALRVHGLTTEFLSDKPKFAEIAKALCDYLRDAEIIIHNAPFDVGFLDAEFEKAQSALQRSRSQLDNLNKELARAEREKGAAEAKVDALRQATLHKDGSGALLTNNRGIEIRGSVASLISA